jgi:BirA family biotin operon repressor/biotin-[acetyl-CoA-carboxylase] ligase
MSFLSRMERFDVVGSTNDVVSRWLAEGTPEVALAVADRQTAGRGREDRTWVAPPGAALLVSFGFRPPSMPATDAWRLAAILAVAAAEAAESVSGLADGTIGLKWPNDLVAEDRNGELRKVAGVLGETTTLDGRVDGAVVGVGLNCDWPASEFPRELASTMASLRQISNRRVDREAILVEMLEPLDRRYRALRRGDFDAEPWLERQRTTGRWLTVTTGGGVLEGRGAGVDPDSGELLVETVRGAIPVGWGEVISCRVSRDGARDADSRAAREPAAV